MSRRHDLSLYRREHDRPDGDVHLGLPDLRGQGVDHAIWVVSSHPRGMCLYSGYNYTGASSGINETVTHGFRVSPVSSVKPCNG